MADMEIKNPKDRLRVLIYGYEGYLTPESRLKTCNIYEGFIYEKVLLMQNFFSKKYDDMVQQVKEGSLSMAMAETLKLFSECRERLDYHLPVLKYFLEESKLDTVKTEILCQNDFEILKNISLIVDKITSLDFISQENIFQLNRCVSNFKTSILKRIDTIVFLNSELKERADDLALLLHEIRNKKATVATYEALDVLLSKYPDCWNFYKEILVCFKNYFSQYLILKDTDIQSDFLKASLFFIDRYEAFIWKLKNFISKAECVTGDEKQCRQDILGKMSGIPDFQKERVQIQILLESTESQSAKNKVMPDSIHKSSVFCDIAEFFEHQMLYGEAMEFYQAAIKNNVGNKNAVKALTRCHNRVQWYGEFQKANSFLVQGKYDKALDLYNQILSRDPDLEPVKLLKVKVNKLEGKNA